MLEESTKEPSDFSHYQCFYCGNQLEALVLFVAVNIGHQARHVVPVSDCYVVNFDVEIHLHGIPCHKTGNLNTDEKQNMLGAGTD